MECVPRQVTVHGKRMIAGCAVEEEGMVGRVVVAGGMMLLGFESVVPIGGRSRCLREG
jgi:hypothetical protein